MSRLRAVPAAQLGFGDLLAEADSANSRAKMERAYAYLPGTEAEALPFYRDLIQRHHAAMLAGDIAAAMPLRQEAHRLAEEDQTKFLSSQAAAGRLAPARVASRRRAPGGALGDCPSEGAAVYQLAFQPGSSSRTIASLLALDPAERWGLLFGDRWIRLGEPSGEMPPVDTAEIMALADWRAEKPLLVNCLRPAIQTKQSQHPAETPLRYSFIITEGDAP